MRNLRWPNWPTSMASHARRKMLRWRTTPTTSAMPPGSTVKKDSGCSNRSGSAPTIINQLCSIRNHCGRVDLHQIFRTCKRRHHDTGRYRKHTFEPATDHAIHIFAIAWIGDINRHLADVLQLAAGFLEQHVDVIHRLLGLAFDVTDADAFGGIQILPDLTAQEDGRAARDDCLAQVVIDLLFRIGVFGIESANARVFHESLSESVV